MLPCNNIIIEVHAVSGLPAVKSVGNQCQIPAVQLIYHAVVLNTVQQLLLVQMKTYEGTREHCLLLQRRTMPLVGMLSIRNGTMWFVY